MQDDQKTKAELLQELDSLRERVSELEQAKEKLHKSELRCRSLTDDILDSSKVGIFILDDSFKVVWMNQALERYFGLRRKDVIGKDKRELILKQIKDIFEEPETFVEKVFATYDNNTHIESFECHVLPDGERHERWLEYWSQPITSGFCVGGRIEHYYDITERKQAEGAYHSLVDHSLQGLAIFQNGRVVFANQAMADITGYTVEEILATPPERVQAFVYPDDRELVWSRHRDRLNGEELQERYELRGIRKDGSMCWLEIHASRIEFQGKPAIQAAYVDITEQKRAGEALRESEQRYRLFMQGFHGIAYQGDMNFVPIFFQGAVKEITGYTEEEFLAGKLRWDQIIHKDDLPKIYEEAEKIRSIPNYSLQLEYRIMHKDGKIKWIREYIQNICDVSGRPGKVQGAIYDITEHKKVEEALHESEQKYRTLVETAGESIATINKDGVFLFMNETGAKRLGGKPEDYVGKTMWDLFPKKTADQQASGVRKVINTGKGRNIVSLTELQGQLRWYNTTTEPLRDDSGKVIAVMVIARDIHELKQAEEELNKYREQMTRAEELASVGTLSATLAHELTQPLTVISLSIENSLAELEKTSCPDTVVENLKEGLSEIWRMTSMLNRFRNFARMSSEKTVKEVELKAVAERIVNLFDESAWRAKVALQVEGMDKLPRIYSYERELEQLFFSLIENAIQAADGKKRRQVIISSAVKDEHIELQFSDNCGGIAPENLDKIFEPFFTTKPAGEGTGLGLCVVERIVSQLGGEVRVKSKLGKGSTFFVTVPIKGDES
jgi:PAS domain S-box-containing protein